MYGDLVRYGHARGRWLVWDTHRWRSDDDAAVHRMALESVRVRLEAVLDGDLPGEQRTKILRHEINSEARTRLDALLPVARTMRPIATNRQRGDSNTRLVRV